jgi:hypothetical protein
MPENNLASSVLKPTGESLLSPALTDFARFGYRIALEGVFRCDVNGMQFDALYKTDPKGGFTQAHRYLKWTPETPVLESADPANHRYVFRIPSEGRWEGQSVGVRIDVDRFVDEFLIPPSEVKNALSGEIKMTVLQVPLAPPSPWPLLIGASLPAAVMIGGVGLVIRRRMTLGGLAYDLQVKVGQIEQKYRAARAALSRQDSRLLPIQERLAALKEGALALARQIQTLRSTQSSIDRPVLEAEMRVLQRHLTTLDASPIRQESERTLAEKRKTLTLLEEIARTESLCALRLAKIEAVLDTTGLTLRSVQASATTVPPEESLCQALDREVAALYETEREFAACESLRTQVLARR